MRIALAQLTVTTDPQENLALVSDFASRAAREGAELVVFPEATMCSFRRNPARAAEPAGGPWASAVQALAAELGVVIAAGMFTTAPDGRVRNTLLVTDRDLVCYDKIHLFDALGQRESDRVAPGDRLVVAEVAGERLGLAICYDVRFPAQFTELARRGARAMLVCASWAPGPDKVHQWRTLVTARAMDSVSFVVAVDQAGPAEDYGLPTGVGHSMVVDPSGRVLLELGEQPDLAVVNLDLALADRARERLPVLADVSYSPRLLTTRSGWADDGSENVL
ncbi:Carbon-nitrogen hydrolase domain profile [Propionibacterium ruminifibrarum]|uniref:Carbon-nitrogen hydrolase domain profile n=1 Tax=Propionibacterium ruminifibrarum TaxID=1962131 RepID=A0A375I0I1_9ACTN|nr:carbon-nitrogen hydrolase family protein [Propionibacterium ruminifibrarum]SPF68287.1 Carbon-nitrogen hydrolase domain profile [Propionibacterium ruminifibrarum]